MGITTATAQLSIKYAISGRLYMLFLSRLMLFLSLCCWCWLSLGSFQFWCFCKYSMSACTSNERLSHSFVWLFFARHNHKFTIYWYYLTCNWWSCFVFEAFWNVEFRLRGITNIGFDQSLLKFNLCFKCWILHASTFAWLNMTLMPS